MTRSGASTVLLSMLLLFHMAKLAGPLQQQSVSDYGTYWLASSYVAQHRGADIYAAEGERDMHAYFKEDPLHRHFTEAFENTQSPLLYGLVHWLSTGDSIRDLRLYQIGSLMIFGAALAFFFAQLQFPAWGGLLISLFILSLFPPFRFELANANVNRMLLGFVALSLWLSQRRWKGATFLSWVVWGLAISFKPTVALAPFLLWCAHAMAGQGARIRQEALGLACGGASAFLLGCWFFGNWSCWSSWLGRLSRMPLSASPLEHFNFSLPMLAAAGLKADISLLTMAVMLPLSLLLTLWLWYRGIRPRESGDTSRAANRSPQADTYLVALGLMIYLLWAPLVWLHYHLLGLPMMILVIKRHVMRQPIRPWADAAMAVLAVVAVVLLSTIPVHFVRPSDHVLLILCSMVWLGSALLFTLGLLDFRRSLDRDTDGPGYCP